ncbi:MAG: nucleotidyltransferase family protein [Clostridiaceae bacterium]|nr:nucleotidyltransferase family protein [Clostridiaceae bacterium]
MKVNKDHKTENFSPEMRLMLLCSLKQMSKEQIGKAREIISSGVERHAFIELIDQHRLIPVVCNHMFTHAGLTADDPLMKELRVFRNRRMIRSLKLASAWAEINAALNEAGIRVLQLKGPALCLQIHGDIHSRISKDLDLLVDRDDIDEADRVLRAAEYKRISPSPDLTPKQMKMWQKNHHHYSYIGANTINIELHFRLSTFVYGISFDMLWKNRRVGRFGKAEYAYLSPEEELLYYAYHGAQHAWNRLRWLVDIDELLRAGNANLDHLVRLARERRQTHVLSQAVLLCERLFLSDIPEALRETVNDDPLGKRIAEMAIPFILASEDGAGNLALKKYGLWIQRGFSQKRRFIAMHFQPQEKDFQSVKFADKVFFAYYPVRILNWAKKRLFGKRGQK